MGELAVDCGCERGRPLRMCGERSEDALVSCVEATEVAEPQEDEAFGGALAARADCLVGDAWSNGFGRLPVPVCNRGDSCCLGVACTMVPGRSPLGCSNKTGLTLSSTSSALLSEYVASSSIMEMGRRLSPNWRHSYLRGEPLQVPYSKKYYIK
mmetsp:Transcript_32093/g.73354  ORF Transcript_32093/g.73354 Transcript_32093/m.73354 type:complete len:154 (-) Transcript_32093:8-469(-)